jgi:hypothetical protein
MFRPMNGSLNDSSLDKTCFVATSLGQARLTAMLYLIICMIDIEHSLAFHKPKHARISPAIDETDNESVNCVCHNESYRASLPTE